MHEIIVHIFEIKVLDKRAQLVYNMGEHNKCMKGGLKMSVGEKIRALRGSETKESVAGKMGVTVSSWTKYERDERIPRDELKVKIAEYFGTTVQNIFFEKSEH